MSDCCFRPNYSSTYKNAKMDFLIVKCKLKLSKKSPKNPLENQLSGLVWFNQVNLLRIELLIFANELVVLSKVWYRLSLFKICRQKMISNYSPYYLEKKTCTSDCSPVGRWSHLKGPQLSHLQTESESSSFSTSSNAPHTLNSYKRFPVIYITGVLTVCLHDRGNT